jgi:hypothetical protein
MKNESKLGNEDRTTALEDYILKGFWRGWRNYVKGIRAENERSNKRLYRVLWKFKSQLFTTEVDAFAKINGGLPKIRVAKEPKGIRLKDNRWRSIPEIWIEQKQTAQGPAGSIYIQVKDNRWITFHF